MHLKVIYLIYLIDSFSLALISTFFFLTIQQNGYPSRRRSLVDDARFETQVVKQTKETVLEEAREKANGMYKNRKLIVFFGNSSLAIYTVAIGQISLLAFVR